MREIKFRAWGVMFRHEQPKMVYYPLWSTLHSGEVLVFEKEHSYVDDSGYNNDLVLMQYTGLKDKKGKEIYEGDIVMNQAQAKREVRRTHYGEHKLFIGKHSDSFYDGWIRGTTWEVIGNIYENPELLKEERK